MPEEIVNHGVIMGQRADDYIAGGSPIPYVARTDGDWSSFLPRPEWQLRQGLDVMACVTFSALNSLETQYKLITGDEINFSDRFTATMSGTTPQGNYLWKVGDSIRRDGLVAENIWPWDTALTWAEYYTFPPIEVINQAREFLKHWNIQYEWVEITPSNMRYHLKHAPLQVIIPGHAVLNFFNDGDVQKYFDSYDPFVKKYNIPFVSAFKIVLTKKTTMTEQDVKELQALEGYSDPSGVLYWTGKNLSDYLKARLEDKVKTINIALTPSPEN